MRVWPSAKASRVLRALKRIGWIDADRKGGSHRQLTRVGFADYTWAFHDGDEIGPKMMARIAKMTGLLPKDL